jgi:hypothetical protein
MLPGREKPGTPESERAIGERALHALHAAGADEAVFQYEIVGRDVQQQCGGVLGFGGDLRSGAVDRVAGGHGLAAREAPEARGVAAVSPPMTRMSRG